MNNRISSMEALINANMAAISIMHVAANHGARYLPHVDTYMSNGQPHISLMLSERETEFPPSEVSRWQLAIPGAWDMSTLVTGESRLRYTEVDYQGYTVHIRICEPKRIRFEARQALTLAALA